MGPPTAQSPFRLLVEGTDDRCSIVHLLKRHDYDWDDERRVRPYIRDAVGVEQLLDSIGTNLKTYERIGVVLDADDDLGARWAALGDRFARGGVILPAHPDPNGIVIDVNATRATRIGIWLMPDNTVQGYLEHFIEKLVPTQHPLWLHAHTATTAAFAAGSQLPERHHIKGALYAWLAWQQEPGLPFGTALRAKLLGCDSVEALRFVAWFKRLFE